MKSSLDIFGDASKLLGNAMDAIKTVSKVRQFPKTADQCLRIVFVDSPRGRNGRHGHFECLYGQWLIYSSNIQFQLSS